MSKKSPLISVVMPVYNAEAHLPVAIESILQQTHTNIEFIIINDGSTDNSYNIISLYAKKDTRIIVVSRENQGLVYSLNEAIELATGDYIARMDSDDISLEKRLAIQLAEIKRLNVDALSVAYNKISENGDMFGPSVVHPASSDIIKLFLTFCCPICHPGVLAKSSVLKSHKYNDSIAEDHDLWCRLSKSYKLGNVLEPLMLYRVSSSSLSQVNKVKIRYETLKNGFHLFCSSFKEIASYKFPSPDARKKYKTLNWSRAKLVFCIARILNAIF